MLSHAITVTGSDVNSQELKFANIHLDIIEKLSYTTYHIPNTTHFTLLIPPNI